MKQDLIFGSKHQGLESRAQKMKKMLDLVRQASIFGTGRNIRQRRNNTWFAIANIKDWSPAHKNKKDA